MAPFFKILVYAYGNPGREDDGLGNSLVSMLEKWAAENDLDWIDFDSNYQLNIEDAEMISRYSHIIFADASAEDLEEFILTKVTGENEVSFTSHAASPGYIVKLCNELFGHAPEVYLLHIKGYQWEFREGISPKALENLGKAFIFMKNYIMNLVQDKCT